MRILLKAYFLFITSVICLTGASAYAGEVKAGVAQKEWTFLIYLNGNNNLDSFGKMNINQMEGVGSTDKINILVQWASLENRKTTRLFITKDRDTTKVTSPVVQDLGKVDMGDWKSIVDFVQWGVKNYPAQHYFVDIWDHGSGWHALRAKNRMSGNISPLDISWDDNTGNHITTVQLGKALAESAKIIGHKIDLYGSDACLMAMAEVAAEVADSVDVFAGSEEVEPGAGWPYEALLQRWSEKSASPADVAKILTEEYVKSYEGGSNGSEAATFSAFDLSKMDELNSSIAALGKSITAMDASARSQVLNAVNGAQGFTDSDYKDLSDFLSMLETQNVKGISKGISDQVKQSIADFVIAHDATSDYAKALGVSIWLPADMDTYNANLAGYNALKFEAKTGWGKALQSLLQ